MAKNTLSPRISARKPNASNSNFQVLLSATGSDYLRLQFENSEVNNLRAYCLACCIELVLGRLSLTGATITGIASHADALRLARQFKRAAKSQRLPAGWDSFQALSDATLRFTRRAINEIAPGCVWVFDQSFGVSTASQGDVA